MTTEFVSVCLCSLFYVAQGFTGSYFDRDYVKKDLNKQFYNSDLRKMQLECVDETRVNPESVLHLKLGSWSNPDFELRDWAFCLLVKAGLMTKNGVFLMDEALSKVPKDEKLMVEKKIDNCLYAIQRRIIPQNIAWFYLKCYNAENPKKLMLL